jgi:murein DD-endopeptidase MepM/ murein hydrolase activator NlpD
MPGPLATYAAKVAANIALDPKRRSEATKLIAAVAALALFGPLLFVVFIASVAQLGGSSSTGGCGQDASGALVSDPNAQPSGGGAGVPFQLPDPPPGGPYLQTSDPAKPPPAPGALPANQKQVMEAAQQKIGVPWFVLAAISWDELRHNIDKSTWSVNSAGAYGNMQFLKGTFDSYGVDGDGNGVPEWGSWQDQIFSAANYLKSGGLLEGPEGVKKALWHYNPIVSYRNDILFYAKYYAEGKATVSDGVAPDCPANGYATGNIAIAINFAMEQYRAHKPYVLGADGPDAWDCSSLVQAAYKAAGVSIPRRASQQADAVPIVMKHPINPALLLPGDLLFMAYDGEGSDNFSKALGTKLQHVAMYVGQGMVVEAANERDGLLFTKWSAGQLAQVTGVGRPISPGANGQNLQGGGGGGGSGATGSWARPVEGVPSSGFGQRSGGFHYGQDLAAPHGTAIYAVANGTVDFAGPAGGYGNYIDIDHGGGFHTGYGHEYVVLVTNGQQVTRGQLIARVGSEGESTGPHLHFNVLVNPKGGVFDHTAYVDPKPQLISHGVSYWSGSGV